MLVFLGYMVNLQLIWQLKATVLYRLCIDQSLYGFHTLYAFAHLAVSCTPVVLEICCVFARFCGGLWGLKPPPKLWSHCPLKCQRLCIPLCYICVNEKKCQAPSKPPIKLGLEPPPIGGTGTPNWLPSVALISKSQLRTCLYENWANLPHI